MTKRNPERDAETNESTVSEAPEVAEASASSRRRKLEKSIENGVVLITAVGGAEGQMSFALASLSEEIVARLAEHGLSQKLGDAAASAQDGLDAEAKIKTCWDGLIAGDWSTRAPAQPKLTRKNLAEKLSDLTDEERAQTEAVLAKLGIKL